MVLYKYTCCCLSVSEERVDVCLSLPQYQEASPLTLYCDNKGQSRTISRKRSYRVSSIRCWGCSLHISVQLLFEGGIYFSGKPTDINDSWIRYVQVIQRWLLDVTCNLSVPLSAMEKSCTTWTARALTWWWSSELFAHAAYSCCSCISRAASSRRNTVSHKINVLLWRL